MKRWIFWLLLAALALAALAYVSLSARETRLPKGYQGLSNPVPATASNLAAGRRLYALNCAFCHGLGARGDGVPAAGLEPRPADLIEEERRLADDAFMYEINAGERQTAMPAWENILSEQQRWQIILYLRHLGGQVESAPESPK